VLAATEPRLIRPYRDLAMLEAQRALSRTLQRTALVGFGMVMGTGAWFAAAAWFVLLISPDANLTLHLAAFALLNAAVAVGLVAARRVQRDKGAMKGPRVIRAKGSSHGRDRLRRTA